MKQTKIFAIAAALILAGCSSHQLVNENTGNKNREIPIEFSVQKQNITKANLEDVKHYNFGVWAWKVGGKNGLADAEIMDHYLVGWSNNSNKGYYYDPAKTSTWAAVPGAANDYTSPWFYEGLGYNEYEYTGDAGFYKSENDASNHYAYNDYKSVKANQYLRYWDLAYENTNFYCYAPYNANVTFTHTDATTTKTGTSTMTFPATGAIRDGYDEPQNHAYDSYSRTLGEFMYAGVQSTNSNLADVTIPFKHMGAQLFIRFYEDVPGYRVEIVNLSEDHGALASGTASDDANMGIQATPAVQTAAPSTYTAAEAEAYNAGLTGAVSTSDINPSTSTYYTAAEAATYNALLTGAKAAGDNKPGTYTLGTYYTTQGATVTFAEATATASYTANWTGSTAVSTPLMFLIPQEGKGVAGINPANLTTFATSHKVIPEKVASGAQTYSYSPTVYYPVAQPTTSTTGLTFHVSYRVIAEDNNEIITIHNATVHVPVTGTVIDNNETSPSTPSSDTQTYITAWQHNVKYTYTFKITRGSTGTTNPGTAINPNDPSVSAEMSLYPIVFDCATIDDYTTNFSEYEVSENTSY